MSCPRWIQALGEEGDGGNVGHVELMRIRPFAGAEADGFGQRREIFRIAPGHDDLGPLIGQHHGEGGTEATTGARHDNPLAC